MGNRIAQKLLLIGWDAADWRIIRPLIAKGWMPNLKRLIDEGASGSLASLQPMICPMLWTSLATGKRPYKHGIHGYAEVRPRDDGIRAPVRTSRTGKALWNILTQNALRTHCINWPASHPAESINGVCISNRFAILPSRPGRPWPSTEKAVHPLDVAETLNEFRMRPEELDASALLPFVPRAAEIDQDKDKRLLAVAILLSRASTVHAAATWAIENRPWDFAAVLYDGIELFCQQFMEYHGSKDDSEIYRHVVTAAYAFHDMMLGRLLQIAGSEATVLLVSDHGYQGAAGRSDNPEETHRRQGLWVMHGPQVKQGNEVMGASLLDITPTVLTLFGVPSGTDMDGRPLLEVIDAHGMKVETGRISSWDDIADDSHMPSADGESGDDESIEHLLQLGYVEPRDATTIDSINRTREQNQFNLARALLDAGQPARAISLLEPLVKRQPTHVGYIQSLFQAYLVVNRLAEARSIIEIGLSSGGPPALAHVALGAVDLAQRRPTMALAHLQLAEAADATVPGLQVLVGQGYLRMRRWEDAQRAFDNALQNDVDNESAWHGLATVALAQHRNEHAVEMALRAVSLRPAYSEAHYHLGLGLMGLGKCEEAAIAFKRCLSLRPDMLPAYRGLIELYDGPLRDRESARSYRRDAHIIMFQRRLNRRMAQPPWSPGFSGPSGPTSP